VIIVDDHPIWRQGLRNALASQIWAGEIVEAGSLAEAMRVVAGDDIVAMDIHLPDGDGIAAAQDLVQNCPAARVVSMTMLPTAEEYDRAVAAGIHGYIAKSAAPDTIVEAFRTVVSGGSFLDPSAVLATAVAATVALPPLFEKLTSREREILTRVVHGDTSKRIAYELAGSQLQAWSDADFR
jgi:DNA-binding NarL/FixJ family response regulator